LARSSIRCSRRPGDSKTPCPKREQPAFTGRDAVYSSGLIPFEGVGGNTFKVPIADDAQTGTYGFYCNVHGPLQYGQVEIVDKGTEIPSASEVAKTAREEAEKRAEVLVSNHKAAEAGKPVTAGETGNEKFETKAKKLIGVPNPFIHEKQLIHGIINEFVPRDVAAKVGEKVTWTFAGMHTISFNVPKYFPVFTIADDGRVELNPKASEPAGWPGPPEQPGSGGHDDEGGGEGPEPEPVKVDAGAWDGKGFRSTGLDYPEGAEFSVTFTKAGTYPFACLIHPPMVGKIVVK
jgi:plastocyanin